jgi:hypothetical protein
VPGAVKTEFVLAHDADGFETNPGVAADGSFVVGGWVDDEAVVAEVDNEVAGKRAD